MTVLDSFRLDGKVAVVTGGNRGLGEAFARALSEAGARVAIAARDHARSQAVAGELGLLAVRADITDPADVHAMVGEVTDAARRRSTCWSTTPAYASTARRSRCRAMSGGRSSTINVHGLWYCSPDRSASR